MKFCSKCGKHYKDSDKFCKDCGVELTQGTPDGEKLNEFKESASQMLSQAGNKAASAAENLKGMDVEKGKQVINQGTKKFQALSGNIKKIIAAVVILVVAFACYQYFSPEKQVIRAFDNSIEIMTDLGSKFIGEYSDKDIQKFASMYVPGKRPEIQQKLTQARDYLAKNPDADRNSVNRSLGNLIIQDCKAESATVNGNSAVVTIVNKQGKPAGTQPMKKVDGDWYISGLPGDRD